MLRLSKGSLPLIATRAQAACYSLSSKIRKLCSQLEITCASYPWHPVSRQGRSVPPPKLTPPSCASPWVIAMLGALNENTTPRNFAFSYKHGLLRARPVSRKALTQIHQRNSFPISPTNALLLCRSLFEYPFVCSTEGSACTGRSGGGTIAKLLHERRNELIKGTRISECMHASVMLWTSNSEDRDV